MCSSDLGEGEREREGERGFRRVLRERVLPSFERGGGRKRGQAARGTVLRPSSRCGSLVSYLFLVLIFHAEPLLYAVACLKESLPLCSLCQDTHKQSGQIHTGKQHCVGHEL